MRARNPDNQREGKAVHEALELLMREHKELKRQEALSTERAEMIWGEIWPKHRFQIHHIILK